ncbi:hypothetical protein [Dehalobacter restrictus]|jgi:5-methylcytosine-specific restriction endonuclease McrA|uniref:hypothetical protein n=1 Tax=Dehalobacter restrictus TaxID=55583 RepID=UPI00338E6AC8
MTRNVLTCAKCGGNDFEVSYSTDCSRDEKGNENWELVLVCNHCGYLTTIARTRGYIAEIEPVN